MLPEIKTLLYASDISEGSRPAFRMAVQQAIKHDAQIIFLHAVEPIDELLNDFLPANASEKHHQQMMQNYREQIEQRIEDFLQLELETGYQLPHPPLVRVMEGKPDKIILQAAQELDASMIIMGDRESSTISRMFLGSIARKVIHNSDIPTLIVPLKETHP